VVFDEASRMLLQLAEDVEVALLVGIHAGGGVEHAEEVAHAAVGIGSFLF